jgi:hypothetical protein
MIRRGRFARWDNREFEIVSYRRQYYLKSSDPSDRQWGFQVMNGRQEVFFKPILVTDLEDAYEIIPYVFISGYRFAIESYNVETGMLTLVTNNPFVQKKIPVRPHGKYEYIIDVSVHELKIEEDRIPILGFDSTYP